MFPHATCICVNAAQKIKFDADIQEYQNHRYHKEQQLYHHPQHHYQDNKDRNENRKQFKENSWIIHRHVDFVKISVLSPLQVSSILQQTQLGLCNKQVSHIQTISI